MPIKLTRLKVAFPELWENVNYTRQKLPSWSNGETLGMRPMTSLKDFQIREAVQGMRGGLRDRAVMRLLQHPELIGAAAQAQRQTRMARVRAYRWPEETRLAEAHHELDPYAKP